MCSKLPVDVWEEKLATKHKHSHIMNEKTFEVVVKEFLGTNFGRFDGYCKGKVSEIRHPRSANAEFRMAIGDMDAKPNEF